MWAETRAAAAAGRALRIRSTSGRESIPAFALSAPSQSLMKRLSSGLFFCARSGGDVAGVSGGGRSLAARFGIRARTTSTAPGDRALFGRAAMALAIGEARWPHWPRKAELNSNAVRPPPLRSCGRAARARAGVVTDGV